MTPREALALIEEQTARMFPPGKTDRVRREWARGCVAGARRLASLLEAPPVDEAALVQVREQRKQAEDIAQTEREEVRWRYE